MKANAFVLSAALALVLTGCSDGSSRSTSTSTASANGTTVSTTTVTTEEDGVIEKMVRKEISEGLGKHGMNVAMVDGKVILRADGQPEATIAADGALTIGGTAVTLTAEQQALTKSLHAESIALADSAMALGKGAAGIAVKASKGAIVTAIKSIANPDAADVQSAELEKTIEAAVASDISGHALKVCNTSNAMDDLRAKIAASLPAFKPYYKEPSRCDPSDILAKTSAAARP